jgi:Zn-dependent peptidase ImmA (M78 family)
MDNKNEVQNLIKEWQQSLGLEDWNIDFKFVDFDRTDYWQSGDVEVDIRSKKAMILISNNPKFKEEQIVVHELVHLLLWEYDHYCESLIADNKKGHYFDLLEGAAAKFTKILLKQKCS